MQRWTFSLTADSARDPLRAGLPAGMRLGEARAQRPRRTWVDTFDWRLHRAGLAAHFVKTGPQRWRLAVRDREGAEGAAELAAAPGLAVDLPAGPVHDLVAPAIGIRRLLAQVTVASRRSRFTLLDDLDKTIGEIAVDEPTASVPGSRRKVPMDRRVVLTALRGFEREVEAAGRALESAGVLAPDPRRELDAALAAIGRAAGDYSSRLDFRLEAAMPGRAALADIFEELLATMRLNEAGAGERLDEEFLHDYRVAVRRTRSALSHFGGALPPAVRRWGRGFFADLGRRTGAARDLDVLLLEIPGYADRLPEAQRPGLDKLVDRLASDCAREYALLRRWLGARTYRRGVERWQEEIDELRQAGDGETIGALAAAAIRATAAKVFKQAKRIGRSDADEPVHRLRIRCKKLRYALEFSQSLTPGGEVGQLISALKRLQDVLGTFNDVVVHGPRLVATAGREPADPEVSLAAGWILAELDRRHRAARRRVDAKVKRFRRDGPPLLERLLDHLPEPAA